MLCRTSVSRAKSMLQTNRIPDKITKMLYLNGNQADSTSRNGRFFKSCTNLTLCAVNGVTNLVYYHTTYL